MGAFQADYAVPHRQLALVRDAKTGPGALRAARDAALGLVSALSAMPALGLYRVWCVAACTCRAAGKGGGNGAEGLLVDSYPWKGTCLRTASNC